MPGSRPEVPVRNTWISGSACTLAAAPKPDRTSSPNARSRPVTAFRGASAPAAPAGAAPFGALPFCTDVGFANVIDAITPWSTTTFQPPPGSRRHIEMNQPTVSSFKIGLGGALNTQGPRETARSPDRETYTHSGAQSRTPFDAGLPSCLGRPG